MNESHRPKVLVADDEQAIANTLTMILIAAKYDARAVYSGERAVEMARSFQPDILISDVILPGITGIEAAVKVHSMLPSCKILLFSGQSSAAELLEAARNQKHEFEILSKPVHPTYLLSRLQSVAHN